MNKLKFFLIRPLLVVGLLLLFSATGALAQRTSNPRSGGPRAGTPTTPAPVPLDGGASLLMAAGAAYGIKKVAEFRKKKQQEA